jgi:hypothetical protein
MVLAWLQDQRPKTWNAGSVALTTFSSDVPKRIVKRRSWQEVSARSITIASGGMVTSFAQSRDVKVGRPEEGFARNTIHAGGARATHESMDAVSEIQTARTGRPASWFLNLRKRRLSKRRERLARKRKRSTLISVMAFGIK